jgi:flagellar FliL protein
MAEEEKEEAKEEKEEKSSDGGNKLILIIIVVLLLLLLIIGGLVAYFLLASPDKEEAQPQADKKVEQPAPKKDSEALEIGPIYPLDPFTVNLKSVNGSRYLKCTINLELDSPDTQPELDKIKPAIRDVIIRILSSKTVPEISTAKGKEKLKKELKKNINAILPKGEIRHVYFTAFVIQ